MTIKQKMNREELKSILEKFKSNKASEEEIKIAVSYFKFLEQRSISKWDETIFGSEELVKNRIFDKVQLCINKYEKKRKRIVWTSIAASILIFLIAGYFLKSYFINKSEEIISFSTKAAQTDTIFLPDGSKVILNSLSSVSFTKGFKNGRTINLIGEAFFDIIKDPNNPFTVHSYNVNTKVLGTSFNINSYDSSKVVVSVVTGKVNVGFNNIKSKGYSLIPGQQATLKTANHQISFNYFNITQIASWREGVLDFNKISLKEVGKILKDHFGKTIIFENEELGNKIVKTQYKDQPFDSIVKDLAFISKLNIQYNDSSTVVIKSKK